MYNLIKRAAMTFAGAAIVLSGSASYAALEEIVVTATKREASLQDVPLSITAVSGKTLELMGAESLLDFAVKIPNLAMAYEADGRFDSSSPSIRGVFGGNTTGLYVDDTRVNASLLPRVVDLARVEVLRGPQGSLYGARSMGGTIRLITKQAELNETYGAVNVQLSSVEDGGENYSFDANYNFPVIQDKVAMRVNAYYGDMSGIQDRVFQSTWNEVTRGIVRQTNAPDFGRNEDVDDESYLGGQLAATIKISDTLEFRPKIMFQSVEADGLPFSDIDPDNVEQLRFFDIEEPGTDDWVVASGTFDWDVANGNVNSTTSYYTRETDETEEETTFLHFLYDAVIGIPIDPFASPISTIEDYQSFSHETRFTSDYDGPVQFTAGIYYEDLSFDHRYPAALQPGANAALNAFIGAPADIVPGDLIFVTSTITDTEEFAVFGELSYAFNDAWSVTAGGRYYDTSVAAVNASDGFANGGPTSFDEKQSEDGFNPKVSVQYEANENLNIYSSAAKGFRIGGVNGNVPASLCGAELAVLGVNPSNATTYDSDELWSYELGFKSTLADNRVTLNAAAFFIDWTDVQQLNRLACGFQFTDNAGEAESKGFEVEINAAPTDNLTITAGAGYTKAEITDTGGVAGVTVGDKIQGVPDWTVTSSVQYDFELNSDWGGVLRADANYYGESFSSNNEASAATQRLRDSWSTANIRLSAVNEKVEVTLFVDNVTDERANLADSRSIAAETPGRQRLVTNRPRTIGIEARMRF
ncbi:MAG: iron complex outermembrane receptor protein [Arenicella sp.]|jgi:iron complex outermembrane receptor protein